MSVTLPHTMFVCPEDKVVAAPLLVDRSGPTRPGLMVFQHAECRHAFYSDEWMLVELFPGYATLTRKAV